MHALLDDWRERDDTRAFDHQQFNLVSAPNRQRTRGDHR
jgi:hypothetical protein